MLESTVANTKHVQNNMFLAIFTKSTRILAN